MNLSSTRSLNSIGPVLQNPDNLGPDPVYWVFSNLSKQSWMNLTVIAPGFFSRDLIPTGGEFPKTFGHYHGSDAPETYRVIEGKSILMLQKKHFDAEKKWVTDFVDQVILINALPGDEITIKSVWGHCWSNVGGTPFLTYDNWRQGHQPADYEVIAKLKGMAYYIGLEDGQLRLTPNPNYKNLPQPVWMTAAQFKVSQSF